MKKMKPSALKGATVVVLLTLGLITNSIYCDKVREEKKLVYLNDIYESSLKEEDKEEIEPEVVIPERVEVYDGLTMEELTNKLNNVLASDLTGKGNYFASYAIELDVDPYLAVAIALHETGCAWDCSYLMKVCNNVGGQKGYGCGQYQAFDTLEEGIYGFISNIKRNYVDYGLYTAEDMSLKYAEDSSWASKVNKYIEKIKNS